jgi:hypothetical protein
VPFRLPAHEASTFSPPAASAPDPPLYPRCDDGRGSAPAACDPRMQTGPRAHRPHPDRALATDLWRLDRVLGIATAIEHGLIPLHPSPEPDQVLAPSCGSWALLPVRGGRLEARRPLR